MGMRIGELLALQWKDIDFDNNTVYVCKTLIEVNNPDYDNDNKELMKEKGIKKVKFIIQNSTKKSKNRYVPMNSKAKELLLLQKECSEYAEPADYVVNTRNRRTNTIKNISDTIKFIEQAAETKVQASGITSVKWQGVRVTPASLWSGNADIMTVAPLLFVFTKIILIVIIILGGDIMGMTNKQFQGFIRLALGWIDKALEKSPDNQDLIALRDIFQSMLEDD
jgi:hypothetical protein